MDIPVNMIKLHKLSILYLDNYYIQLSLQCEAPKIAKLVYNSNNYGLW